ncbi:hypothetical protein NDU88_001646 [Pleurodeles waltl]|uniref:Uncharacterized protein n=1 Tax=Pleurodeles waltl TaxID=8319 RepID=A0AAV7LZ73_PLEWA|nr:hypothetical protein NDU88_001646 [Pleurodeles waltl]
MPYRTIEDCSRQSSRKNKEDLLCGPELPGSNLSGAGRCRRQQRDAHRAEAERRTRRPTLSWTALGGVVGRTKRTPCAALAPGWRPPLGVQNAPVIVAARRRKRGERGGGGRQGAAASSGIYSDGGSSYSGAPGIEPQRCGARV